PAIVPLRLLGLYGGFRSIINLLPQMLIATGHAKLNMKLNVLTAVALPAVLYLGARWAGITGVALGWVIGYPLITIPSFFRHTLRILGIRAADYLLALWTDAIACNRHLAGARTAAAHQLPLPTRRRGRGAAVAEVVPLRGRARVGPRCDHVRSRQHRRHRPEPPRRPPAGDPSVHLSPAPSGLGTHGGACLARVRLGAPPAASPGRVGGWGPRSGRPAAVARPAGGAVAAVGAARRGAGLLRLARVHPDRALGPGRGAPPDT